MVVVKTTNGGTGWVWKKKELLDRIIGDLQKDDQFYETEPILQKVEDNNGRLASDRGATGALPPKKGGFGGFFANNWK